MNAFSFTAADFTEARYCELLKATAARFRFVGLEDDLTKDGIALWRHDIDISPHRALKLARLEAELNIRSIWFVMLASPFYNIFEPNVAALIRNISAHGHDIGLHFDPPAMATSEEAIEACLLRQVDILSDLIELPVRSFSFHNPTVHPKRQLQGRVHGGLSNASAPFLYYTFSYCSDSNGIWRFRQLHEVIADPATRSLYALTHPVWWTPEEMAPRARVKRAIEGLAAAVLADYDALLANNGRSNVK